MAGLINATHIDRWWAGLIVAFMVFHWCTILLQVAWTSFHNNTALVRKYLATYHIGHLVEEQREVCIMHAANYSMIIACGVFLPQPLYHVV